MWWRWLGSVCVWLAWATNTLMIMMTAGMETHEARSSYRGGRLAVSDPLKVLTASKSHCLVLCRLTQACVAFNHQSVTSTCELLDTYLCKNETTQLSPDSTWRYYDLINPQQLEEEQLFEQHGICSDYGHCSYLCARGMGEQCRANLQCNLTVQGEGHCSANDGTTIGHCACETDYWPYDSKICVHTYSMSAMTWDWTAMKIVNNMCNVTFTAKSTNSLFFWLMNMEDYKYGVTYYRVELGVSHNSYSRIKRVRTEYVRHDGAIFTGNFQNFTMSWCGGRITVAKQGQTPFLDWTDPSPLHVVGLIFYAPSSPDNHLFFPHNVIDPYFPLSLETGSVRTNGHFWRLVKIFPDAQQATSTLNITFRVMAPREAKVLLTHLNDNSKQIQVNIGQNNNKEIWIHDGITRQWVTKVPTTPSPLSSTEFRGFWITLEASTIMVGREGEDTAVANFTDTVRTRSFTHVGLRTGNNDYGYWKMTSLPQFHYPAGTYYL